MTLVLLHPLPLDGSVWSDELRDLAPRTITPTLYDYGDAITDWAAAVLDLAGPGPLDLVGNSVGGSCALEVACLAPDRVRSIVLVGAKAGHRPEPQYRDRAVELLRTHGVESAWRQYWAPLFAPNADPAVVEHAREVACAQGVDAIVDGVLAFHGRPDRSAFAASLDVPIVVVRGALDPIGAKDRRSTDTVVAGCGHYVPLERPAALTDIVRAVLKP
jgi:pimeloyl-ACP methyl ester carboxylesterase